MWDFFALCICRVQTALCSSLRWARSTTRLGLLLSQVPCKVCSGHLSLMWGIVSKHLRYTSWHIIIYCVILKHTEGLCVCDCVCLKEESTLLIFCQNGHVVEVQCPEADHQNIGNTFQLSDLPTIHFCFSSIKSRIKVTQLLCLSPLFLACFVLCLLYLFLSIIIFIKNMAV